MHAAQRSYIVQTIGPPLRKVGTIDLYWIPAERRVAYRNVYPTERKRKTLPDGAIYVGRYTYPCHPDVYVGDIECILDEIHKPRPPVGGVEAQQVAAA